MSRKDGWEKSTSGPDWVDIETMMRALSALHSGHVAVVVSPDGIGFGTGVDVAASILLDVLPGSSVPASVVTHATWPCDTHNTLTSHVYSLLYDLDYEISKVYKQESLWK